MKKEFLVLKILSQRKEDTNVNASFMEKSKSNLIVLEKKNLEVVWFLFLKTF